MHTLLLLQMPVYGLWPYRSAYHHLCEHCIDCLFAGHGDGSRHFLRNHAIFEWAKCRVASRASTSFQDSRGRRLSVPAVVWTASCATSFAAAIFRGAVCPSVLAEPDRGPATEPRHVPLYKQYFYSYSKSGTYHRVNRHPQSHYPHNCMEHGIHAGHGLCSTAENACT